MLYKLHCVKITICSKLISPGRSQAAYGRVYFQDHRQKTKVSPQLFSKIILTVFLAYRTEVISFPYYYGNEIKLIST